MTVGPRDIGLRILVLSDSLGGFGCAIAESLVEHLGERANESTEIDHVDFFERFVPEVEVLGRLAHVQDSSFIPEVTGSLRIVRGVVPDNPVLRALDEGGLDRFADYVRGGSPRLVIATSLVAAAAAAEIASRYGLFVVAVIPSLSARDSWLHPGCNLYFVATKEVREDLMVAGIPYNRIVVSGLPSAVSDAPIAREQLRRNRALPDRFTAVVCDVNSSAVDTKHVAIGLAALGVQVVIPITQGEGRSAQRLKALAQVNELVSLVDATDSTVDAVALGDVVCARAGSRELLGAVSAGIPSILYSPVPRQESESVDFLVNAGLSLLSRDDDDMIEKVRFLSTHPDRLAQLARAAATVGRNSATRLVAERVVAESR